MSIVSSGIAERHSRGGSKLCTEDKIGFGTSATVCRFQNTLVNNQSETKAVLSWLQMIENLINEHLFIIISTWKHSAHTKKKITTHLILLLRLNIFQYLNLLLCYSYVLIQTDSWTPEGFVVFITLQPGIKAMYLGPHWLLTLKNSRESLLICSSSGRTINTAVPFSLTLSASCNLSGPQLSHASYLNYNAANSGTICLGCGGLHCFLLKSDMLSAKDLRSPVLCLKKPCGCHLTPGCKCTPMKWTPSYWLDAACCINATSPHQPNAERKQLQTECMFYLCPIQPGPPRSSALLLRITLPSSLQ